MGSVKAPTAAGHPDAERVKVAGAVVLGKSSCSDLSGSMETDNPITRPPIAASPHGRNVRRMNSPSILTTVELLGRLA